MEKTKRKNSFLSLNRYWCFFLPLAFILALMVRFPLRIALKEIFLDILFYGTISLMCIAVAIRVYRRYSKRGLWLIAMILLCSVLSGWQIFDLVILRYPKYGLMPFGLAGYEYASDYAGIGYYVPRFKDKNNDCHYIREQYFGNYDIAITVKIERDASWYACGG